jgi:hypothetical protein
MPENAHYIFLMKLRERMSNEDLYNIHIYIQDVLKVIGHEEHIKKFRFFILTRLYKSHRSETGRNNSQKSKKFVLDAYW